MQGITAETNKSAARSRSFRFVCSVVAPASGQRYAYSHAFTLLLAYDTSCHLYPFILLTLEIFQILFQSYSHFCRLDRPHAELYIDEGHFGPEELLPVVNNWINHTKEPEESSKLLQHFWTFKSKAEMSCPADNSTVSTQINGNYVPLRPCTGLMLSVLLYLLPPSFLCHL